ncbi:MAG: sugar phosphate nucleotidyltransferase [Desulfomonilaceae bacterium]
MRAIILAGGKGTRLLPYTTVVPKPLLPVGDRPIVEILIDQLVSQGFDRITMALGHLAHLVQAVLGNGDRIGAKCDYTIEDAPLGTSGPLSKIKDITETFLLLNGDILTDIDFGDLVRFHTENEFALTVASHERKIHVDYGVIHKRELEIVKYEEKPVIDLLVSAGIYVLEPSVLKYVTAGSYLDFPDLVQVLLRSGEKIGCYPFHGVWYDLGRLEDFQCVQELLPVLKDKIPLISPQ